jgi:hypothetical protein
MPETEAEPEALPTAMRPSRRVRRWPLFLIAAPAAVAVWSGWVGLGGMCGFGLVQPLPGIVAWHLNTAITLPVGVESYGAYALGAWLTPGVAVTARTFARRSAIGSLALGVLGQVAYHLLAAAHSTRAPWPVVVLVSCLPVVTLGFGAALTHLLRVPVSHVEGNETKPEHEPATVRVSAPEPESPQASTVLSLVAGDAENAAEAAMRATLAASNPLSVNQLSTRFNLTRQAATRVRDRVLAEVASHGLDKLADSAVS